MRWMIILSVILLVSLGGLFTGTPVKTKPVSKGICINFQEKNYKIIPIKKAIAKRTSQSAVDNNNPTEKEGWALFWAFIKKYNNHFYDAYKFIFWMCFTGLAGGFGGYLASHHSKKKDEDEEDKAKTPRELLYKKTVIGIGAAWAITLLMLIAKKYTFEFKVSEFSIIWLFSFMGGLLGKEIVDLASDVILKGLGKKVHKVQNEIIVIRDEVKEEGKKVKKTSNDVVNLHKQTEVLAFYISAINTKSSPTPSAVHKSIEELEKSKNIPLSNDLQRKIYLMLGCLYNKKYEFTKDKTYIDKAINHLNDFLLKCKYPNGKYSKDQVQGALYNLACYFSILIENKESIDKKEEVLKYLNLAFTMEQTFKQNIQVDKDFDNLREYFKPEYEKLINNN